MSFQNLAPLQSVGYLVTMAWGPPGEVFPRLSLRSARARDTPVRWGDRCAGTRLLAGRKEGAIRTPALSGRVGKMTPPDSWMVNDERTDKFSRYLK